MEFIVVVPRAAFRVPSVVWRLFRDGPGRRPFVRHRSPARGGTRNAPTPSIGPLVFAIAVRLLRHVRRDTAFAQLVFEVLADERLFVDVLDLIAGLVFDLLGVPVE